MKRSEAVALVEEHLKFNVYEDDPENLVASDIIKILEQAGLYPPCRRDGKLEWEPETNDHKSN